MSGKSQSGSGISRKFVFAVGKGKQARNGDDEKSVKTECIKNAALFRAVRNSISVIGI